MKAWLSSIVYESFLNTSDLPMVIPFAGSLKISRMDLGVVCRLFMPPNTINAYGDQMSDAWVLFTREVPIEKDQIGKIKPKFGEHRNRT